MLTPAPLINNKEYCFKSIEDDGLMSVMKINDSYNLWRDISSDEAKERWTLVLTYNTIRNSVVTKSDKFRTEVYCGKEISSDTFMKELLEHVLNGIV